MKSRALIGTSLILLVASASIFAHIEINVMNLTRPLVMDALNYDMSAINSVIAIGSILILPLPLISGWLSDRFGRNPVLIVSYLFALTRALLYLVASSLWQFHIANALISVLSCNTVIGTAMIANLVPKENINTNVALFSSTTWIGAVVGSTSAGIITDMIRSTSTFWIALITMVLEVGITTRIQITQKPRELACLITRLRLGYQRHSRTV